MWRYPGVKNIRYMVEKPWDVKPIGEGDEVPHSRWWGESANWEKVADVGIEREVKCIAAGER